jgi:tRNA (guanine-N7-)-methyltransferase
MISKLKRFAEVSNSPNVLEHDKDKIKKLVKKFVQKDKPLILELGCGGGEYTIGLAKAYPDKQIIGIDIQGERLWYGMKDIEKHSLDNALFIRDYVNNINKHFKRKSINEIWITFPDPFPKKRQAKKRLTSPVFLKIYKKILKRDGLINLKTDNYDLYNYSKESITEFGGEITQATEDIYKNPDKLSQELKIKTYFEGKHLKAGRTIYHLQFKLK